MHLGAKSVSFRPIIKKQHLQGEVGSHFEREKGENSILVKALLLLPSVLRERCLASSEDLESSTNVTPVTQDHFYNSSYNTIQYIAK